MTTTQSATTRKTRVAIMNAVHDLPVLVARDLGFFRDIRLTERITFQLRGEATNVFNMVSLNNPSGTSGPPPTVGAAPSSTSFGRITAAASPRLMQVGGRLTF